MDTGRARPGGRAETWRVLPMRKNRSFGGGFAAGSGTVLLCARGARHHPRKGLRPSEPTGSAPLSCCLRKPKCACAPVLRRMTTPLPAAPSGRASSTTTLPGLMAATRRSRASWCAMRRSTGAQASLASHWRCRSVAPLTIAHGDSVSAGISRAPRARSRAYQLAPTTRGVFYMDSDRGRQFSGYSAKIPMPIHPHDYAMS